MGDRLATINMGRKVGAGSCARFCRGAGYPSNTMSPGPRPLPPSSHLATIDMGQKVGLLCPFWEEVGPHLTQCGLDRCLPLYQVASWSIQPFGHNRHGPKIGGGAAVPILGGAGSPTNAMWPWPTSIPSGIFIYPTIWPQYTNVTRQTHRQTTVRSHRVKNFTNDRPKMHILTLNKHETVT